MRKVSRVIAALALVIAVWGVGGASPVLGAAGNMVADVSTPEGAVPEIGLSFDGQYLYYAERNGAVLHRIDVPPLCGTPCVTSVATGHIHIALIPPIPSGFTGEAIALSMRPLATPVPPRAPPSAGPSNPSSPAPVLPASQTYCPPKLRPISGTAPSGVLTSATMLPAAPRTGDAPPTPNTAITSASAAITRETFRITILY